MNEQIKYWKLQKERGELELRYFALDGKDDRTAEESAEMQTLDGKIEEVRGKEMVANVAATEEAERSIVERTSNTPENREVRALRARPDVTLGEAIGQRLGGTEAFTGALGEYVSLCEVKPSEFPLDYFKREAREHRALTSSPTKASQTLQARRRFNLPSCIALRHRPLPRWASSFGRWLQARHTTSSPPRQSPRARKPRARR